MINNIETTSGTSTSTRDKVHKYPRVLRVCLTLLLNFFLLPRYNDVYFHS